MAVARNDRADDESPHVLHPRFVVDAEQKPTAVILSIEEWNRLVEDLEDLADIRACMAAREETSEYIPLEQALEEIRNNRVP